MGPISNKGVGDQTRQDPTCCWVTLRDFPKIISSALFGLGIL